MLAKKFCRLKISPYICSPDAEIAQLVERDLAKVEVAGPNPVFRSRISSSALVPGCFGIGRTESSLSWAANTKTAQEASGFAAADS